MIKVVYVLAYVERQYKKDDGGGYHCEDGPAVIFLNGMKYWMINDRHHRIGAPSVDSPNGLKRWHFEGPRVWPKLK